MSRMKVTAQALWISAAVGLMSIAIFFVVTGPDSPDRAVRKAEVAAANRCLAELASRQPEADADYDIARGDATPIALTSIPHDPPTPTSSYLKACENRYEPQGRPTGKWFKHGVEEFSMWARPDEYYRCRRAAHDYVVRYNQRMIDRAPDSVRRFCESQRLDESARRAAAIAAVYGSRRRPKFIGHGEFQEDIDGVAYVSKAPWLIDLPKGAYLVILSRPLVSGTPCSPGKDCSEFVDLAQLAPKGQQFSLVRRWHEVGRLDDKDWEYGSLSCCGRRLTEYAELAVQERYESDGCRSGRQTILELTPAGPVNRGVIYMDVQLGQKNGHTESHSGRIENVVIGKSFDVVVPHTDIRERYEVRSGRYFGPANSRLRC